MKFLMKFLVKTLFAFTILMAYVASCWATWAPVPANNLNFSAFSVVDKNNIWAIDTTGRAHHWNGKMWKPKPHATTITQIANAKNGIAFIIDATGKILRDVTIELKKLDQKIAQAKATLAKLTAKPATQAQITQQQTRLNKLTADRQTLLTGKPVTPKAPQVPKPVTTTAPKPPVAVDDKKQQRLQELEMTENVLRGQLTVLPESVQGPLLEKIKQIQEEKKQLLK